MMKDREASCAAVHGAQRVIPYWVTEQQLFLFLRIYFFPRIMPEALDNNNKIIIDTNYCILARCFHSYNMLFSCSVMSDWLQPHEPHHTRPPGPSSSPGICSNSRPLSQWCHPTISSSIIPLSSCLQSFPASTSFPVSQFFPSGGQSIGASASALPLQWIFRVDFL